MLLKKANKELIKVQNYMTANQMFLNLKKTVYTLYHPNNRNVKDPPTTVTVGDYPIQMVQDFKFLGVTMQNNKKFNIHYDTIHQKMVKGISALYFVKHDFPSKIKLMIFNALVKSAYEYATPIWSLNLKKYQINELLKLQKRGLRAVYNIRKKCHSDQLFRQSGIVRFDFLFIKYVIELLFKFFINDLPAKIKELLNHFTFPRKLRNSELHIFNIPLHLRQGDLFYNIMSTWNNVPTYIRKEIYEESQKEKPSIMKVKYIAKKYVESLYPICNKKPCFLCTRSKLFTAFTKRN